MVIEKHIGEVRSQSHSAVGVSYATTGLVVAQDYTSDEAGPPLLPPSFRLSLPNRLY